MLEKMTVDDDVGDKDTEASSTSYQCKICQAHATGFHFNAQSCGACAAFFRRAVVLSRQYRCLTGLKNCVIFYKNRALCKACRYEICLESGMSKDLVQLPKDNDSKQRSYFTKSGLKRNKRFSSIKLPTIDTPPPSTEKESSSNENESLKSFESPIKVEHDVKSPFENSQPIEKPTCKRTIATSSHDLQDVLSGLIQEEMRISERRRILFCEKPVANLLGLNSECPFSLEDLKPLKFRNFRKSLRMHILMIHEWLRSWQVYNELSLEDRITFYRKCALYHTILDPCFISLQVGDKSKFVLQTGGYVSLDPDCEEGWQDEAELSKENKKKIYWPLLNRINSDILEPMANLDLSFEEFVALKAIVSIQTTIPDLSENGKVTLKRQLDLLSNSFFNNYLSKCKDNEVRYGSILMLLSPIYEVANIFIEQHHLIVMFDLWEFDSIMLQFLKKTS